MPRNELTMYLSIHEVFRNATVPHHIIMGLIFCCALFFTSCHMELESTLQITNHILDEQTSRVVSGTDTSEESRTLATEPITGIDNTSLLILIGFAIGLAGLFLVGILHMMTNDMDHNLRL